jgi:hypothetical protein
MNCSAASSALVGFKLISQAIQEIGAHAKIIATRKADGARDQNIFVALGMRRITVTSGLSPVAIPQIRRRHSALGTAYGV